MNKNIQGDFQICISVPLKILLKLVKSKNCNLLYIKIDDTKCALN